MPADQLTDIDHLDERILSAYGCLSGEGGDYVRVHYRRYLATLDLLGDLNHARVLELGASEPFAFTLMMRRRFPSAEIVLAQNHRDEMSLRSPVSTQHLSSNTPGFEDISLPLLRFNAETEIWPADSRQFNVVICMEMIEHLLLDPCFVFREASRVLRVGGYFVLTTPNLASLESLYQLACGRSPYRFGVYSPYGPYGRHNREYVPGEIGALGECSGFSNESLTTVDVYRVDHTAVDSAASLLGHWSPDWQPELRRQAIFYKGLNHGGPFRLAPSDLYPSPNPHAAVVRTTSIESGAAACQISVELFNSGSYTWESEGGNITCLGIQLVEAGGTVIDRDLSRVPLTRPVAPGQLIRLTFTMPIQALSYYIKLDMVHEQVCWFADVAATGRPLPVIRIG